jgi:hypothetical protein
MSMGITPSHSNTNRCTSWYTHWYTHWNRIIHCYRNRNWGGDRSMMNQGVWNSHSVLDWIVVVEKGMGEMVSIPIRRIDSDDWHDGRDWMCSGRVTGNVCVIESGR